MGDNKNPAIGIYEKALPSNISWRERLSLAAKAGFDFVEISIDATEERLSRLDWTREKKARLREDISITGIPILTMCLSAHRYFPIGSENREIREKGMEIMKKAIKFSLDVGIRVVQLAGYDVFEEKSNERTKQLFMENLIKSVEWASNSCVTLALENVDTDFMDSISKILKYMDKINSPWLQLYPDIGNLCAASQDVGPELLKGRGRILAVHVKDSRLGIIRRIPFGEGIVPFDTAFKHLFKIGFKGPILIEMWNDDADNSVEIISKAREWVLDRWNQALEQFKQE